MISKQRPKVDEETSHVDFSGKGILGRANNICEGPGVGVCLACLKNDKVSVTGAESAVRREEG